MNIDAKWSLTFRYIVGIVLFIAFIAFLIYAQDAVRMLAIAAFVAYLINPAVDYLSARNVRVCLQGHAPFMAAVNAVRETLKALRGGTPPGKLAGIAAADLMQRVTRQADYANWSKEFLGG